MGAFGALLAVTFSACSPQPASIDPVVIVAPPAIPKDQSVQVFVAAGKFEMGSARYRGEAPPHVVEITHFWIDRTEVTNAQYARCVEQGVCQPPARFSSYARPEYFGNLQYGAYPVIYVNWDDADTFCRWAGRRLPTEAEWERAARGSDQRLYPWGDALPRAGVLNYDFTVGDTSAAGSYPSGASPYGALDMAGNVAEWVADWYESDYYAQSAFSDPGGPLATGARVVRGGSWVDNRNGVRAGQRLGYPPDSAFVNLGFRCAESTGALPSFVQGGGHRTLR
jgi:serine/threonine-protein kinase